ncbi:MAG TPA: sulfatase [Planctomycetota bacterium]
MLEPLRRARVPVLSLALLAAPLQDGVLRLEGPRLRLAEALGSARITSPLNALAPALDLADLEDPDTDLLLEETFEDFDWDYAGWTPGRGADVVAQGENHVLRLAEPSDAFFGWVLPVRSDAFYRFTRAVRVRGVPFGDMVVVESREEPDGVRRDPRMLFLAGRGSALKVHRVALRAAEGEEWQRAGTSFFPTPRTQALVVLFRPDVGVDPDATVRGMIFDELRLEEISPSRSERMRLLMGADVAPDAGAHGALRKAGLLLPLPSPDGVREGEAAESNYDWRSALYAPPPTELAFEVLIPAGARLRLATGLARETPAGSAARFQVELVRPGAEPVRLLDRLRTARMEEWHWEEADLDLAAHAGQTVSLVLRTVSESGDPHPLWADPRLEAAGGAKDPLVILIAVDTLRADRLGCYGYARPTTPALDRLAREGVRFDQARSNCNWTCPSFASIFTGMVPSRHGVTSYGPATPLPDELVTLAEHFQQRGYATRSIAYKVPLFDGHYEQGFERAFNVPRDVIRGEENMARALEWLAGHHGGPAFLFLHFNDPHQPFVQPEPYDRSFGPPPQELGLAMPPQVPADGQEEHQRLFRDLYDGAVAYVDHCIGGFLDALRARGLYEGATIAFVADHGEQLWEHGRFGHGGDDLYDEIVRVPLIVKPPAGSFEAGKVVAADVAGFDVMPTLLELAGIAPAERLDARSLVPLIAGKARERGRPVVTETSQRGLALVSGGYKYVLGPGGDGEALFHLASDPAERNDVVGARPEELARLRALAITYLLEHRPGQFLVVRSEAPARLELSTQSVRRLVGPPVVPVAAAAAGGNAVELPGQGLWLLEIEGEAGALSVHGLPDPLAAAGFAPWEGRSLGEFAGAGVWRVRGPEGRKTLATELDPVDAELLEELKRLGYAE